MVLGASRSGGILISHTGSLSRGSTATWWLCSFSKMITRPRDPCGRNCGGLHQPQESPPLHSPPCRRATVTSRNVRAASCSDFLALDSWLRSWLIVLYPFSCRAAVEEPQRSVLVLVLTA